MNTLVLAVLVIGLPLAFCSATVIGYFEDHPHPLRERRLWNGPRENCFRCGAEVPLGWIAYQREHFAPMFGVRFEDQMDGGYVMRGWGMWLGSGRHCSICDTLWPSDKTKPIRPKFFEYGRNPDFGVQVRGVVASD